ncbi:hypothetical protein [Streptomyces xanthophaeus]|uniref:hypothetical protein n=1 Tax=Streptomyces xanthophaeus TaxID=67385 RepID=UPI003667656C
MAVLSTIAVVLGAWCAASVLTAALYVGLRTGMVRRQRALASVPRPVAGGVVYRGPVERVAVWRAPALRSCVRPGRTRAGTVGP